MKNIIFFFLVALCWSCNNDVTSIGEDLIDNESYVEIKTLQITNTSTVKLDSFPTSTGSTTILENLLAGKVEDPISGTTTVTPYFEIVPSGGTKVIGNIHTYDSLTFDAVFNGQSWGDTTQLQIYHLYQLQHTPELDPEDDLIYNNETVVHHPEPLGSYKTRAERERLKRFRFRLSDEVGRDLFNKLRTSDPVLDDDFDFIRYFKGLVLMPDPNNSCILGFSSNPDSIGLTLHFHNASTELSYKFNKSRTYNKYTFMNMVNNAAGTPYANLENQDENLLFNEAVRPNAPFGQTISQGLSGYMIKMRLPIAPAGDKYKTIVKATIELHPQLYTTRGNYHRPQTIYVYKSNERNEPLSTITNAAGKAVTGTLQQVYNRPEEDKYVINITDYYNTLCQNTDAQNDNYVIVSISLSEMNSSFNRIVIDEVPVLKVYYAQYE